MSKSNKININQMFLKAHKKAVKNAIELAAKTRTSLVSKEGSKIKMVKPNVKYIGFEPIEPSKKARPAPTKKRSAKKIV